MRVIHEVPARADVDLLTRYILENFGSRSNLREA